MFKMTKLHGPVPSWSMAAAIVAATLAAGCDGFDPPSAPQEITDLRLQTVKSERHSRGVEASILPFAFKNISDVIVRRVGKRHLRAGFDASTMVTVECNTSGGNVCEAAGENTAHLQQFFDMFFLFGGDKSARTGRVSGRTRVVLSLTGTGNTVEFRGGVHGVFSCLGVDESVSKCIAEMQIEGRAPGECESSGDLAGTFAVVSDPGVGVIWKRLGSPSGWAMPCVP